MDLSLTRTRGGLGMESSYQEERTGSIICMRVGEFCCTEKRTDEVGKCAGGGSCMGGGEEGWTRGMKAKSLGRRCLVLSTRETERWFEREVRDVPRDFVDRVE